MKKLLKLLSAALAVMMLGLCCPAMSALASEAPGEVFDAFEAPAYTTGAMFRYWVPDASVSEALLHRDFEAIYEAGFAGVEIAHVPYSRVTGDLATYGWGTPAWQQALLNVYRAAADLPEDFRVDVTINTQWPPALNTIDGNDDEASSELAMTTVRVAGPEAMAVTLPQTRLLTDGGEQFVFADVLESAVLARVQDASSETIVIPGQNGQEDTEKTEVTWVLDAQTVQDVTALVREGEETFPAGIPDEADPYCAGLYEAIGQELSLDNWGDRARLQDVQPTYEIDLTGCEALNGYQPSEGDEIAAGDYVLFCFFRRGTGNTITPNGLWGAVYGVTGLSFDTTAFVLDEFNTEGAKALTDYWEANILNDELAEAMRARGGYFFEDSIESTTETIFWNATMADTFEAEKGYAVAPCLPYLLNEADNGLTVLASDGSAAGYLEDYKQVLEGRYAREHLGNLQAWAKETVGFGLRTQSYTHQGSVDEGLAAAQVDMAEGETIEFGTAYDKFRTVAAGVHLSGKNILSDETMARGKPYNMTFEVAANVANAEFAAGVNRLMIHGYSYANTDNMGVEGKDSRDTWPGWTTFATMAGDSWGTREPYWQDAAIIADYIARTQQILQTGAARVDFAILTDAFGGHESIEGASNGSENDRSAYSSLLDLGYTYEVLSEGLVTLEGLAVTDGRLTGGSADYQALVVDNMATLRPATAAAIAEFARQGLPVIFAGSLPEEPYGADDEDARAAFAADVQAAQDAGAVRAPDFEALTAALGERVTDRAIAFEQKDLRAAVRVDEAGNLYYYLYNNSGADVNTTVTLPGEGRLYVLDAWTGAVLDAPVYAAEDGVTRAAVTLEPAGATILALTGEEAPRHIASADALCVAGAEGAVLRATEAGSYAAVLSDGEEIAFEAALPEALTPDTWNITLESWGPDAEANATDLTVSARTTVAFEGAGLGLWRDLPATEDQLAELGVEEMANVGGIAVYDTAFTLPEDWDSAVQGYELTFTHNNDFITAVIVNGQDIGVVDPTAHRVDIGPWLQGGENTLSIRLTGTLANRVIYEARDNEDSLFTKLSFIHQPVEFGLENVVLAPYAQMIVK